MRLYSRRFLVLSVIFGLSACGGGQSAATPSIGAGGNAAAQNVSDVSDGHVVFQKMNVRPDAGAPPLLMNFVEDGPAQGGVPCIGCVSGASSSYTIGLTGPTSYVSSGAAWQYDISFTDISYKGKCKVSWTIVSSKKKTIDSFSASFNITGTGGFILYGLNRNRPKYSGPATLTGKYACGKYSASTQAPLYFQ